MHSVRVEAFGDPAVMHALSVPDPIPGPGQVLVRVRAAGVNPVDTYIRAGNYASKPALPYTPGKDAAGEILAFGSPPPTRPDLKIGSRVWVCQGFASPGPQTGTYAQLCVCDAASVCALPEHVTFEQGAGVGVPYMTAWIALRERASIVPGQTLLVHGATGGVGLAAVQIARALGCMVIGTAGTNEGAALAQREGAHVVVSHKDDAYTDQIMRATGNAGPDVILEMLANVNLAKDLAMIASRGKIIIVGNRGEVTINPRSAMAKDATITGMALANATLPEWTRAMWAVNEGLRNSTLRPVVREKLPLADAPKSHELVLASGAMGKIVLVP